MQQDATDQGFAVKQDILFKNPAKMVEVPKLIKREMVVLTEAEALIFLNASQKERLATLFTFLLASGCRPSEAIGLKWQDLSFDRNSVEIKRVVVWDRNGGSWQFSKPKTAKSRRTTPLPVSLVKELKQHRIRQYKERLKLGIDWQDFDLIFPSQVGTPLTMGRITRVFQRIKKDCKITKPLRLYDLRHSTADAITKDDLEKVGHGKYKCSNTQHNHQELALDE